MKEKRKNGTSLSAYFRWPLILAALLTVCNIAVFILSPEAGRYMAFITILYILIALAVYLFSSRKIHAAMLKFADEYDTTRQRILEEIGTPAVICDAEGGIVWSNAAFRELLKAEKMAEGSILAIFPDFTREMLTPTEDRELLHSSLGEKRYCLELQWGPFLRIRNGHKEEFPQEASDFGILITLTDETELLEYQRLYNDSRSCIGIVALDNYDEALASVDEVRRSLLTALVDRKLSNYFSAMNGIIKKFEADKYLLFMKDRDMSFVIGDRFSVLDDVKTVNIGNSLNLTLSIGVGMRGESYDKNYEAAGKAMDLALGRGGDQAVVISDGEISYYGGKSSASAKMTRVRARTKAHAFREILDSKDQVIVMGHKNADVDALGASVGIWRIAASLGKKAFVVNGNTEATVMPFKNRFSQENGYPADFFISGSRALEIADSSTLIVVVDVNKPSYSEEPQLLQNGAAVVVIDHHRMGTETIENPVLSYVEPYASSASEMVAELLQYVDESIRLEPAEADTLYGGIILDTQNFMVQAGVRTFEAAAFLKRQGADAVRVRKMFRDDISDYKARADAIGRAEVYREHFIISVCDPEGTVSPSIIGAQTANSLLEINHVKAAIVLTPVEGRVLISARSIDEINVQVLMEKLGGGGHKSVAGAQLKDVTTEEAKQRITAAIDQMIEEGEVK